ncbi:chromosome segregation protein SMC [Boudabousia marimammalium]|uniref:Chromosome partition protein Smc n=1 Tax=Boudabousia marimammalium TaxID=156892 RepID=A0A1Q5PRS3_9ACTO|nr:chromosome segregation protein SMC [Boudabousia marimammalium]OKL50135.1 chromosome segregation protein SMC [Boudabousia marimammalium]
MYLKTLTLRGFKSFASTTTLRFEPGITAVVGPNGSGKSNVVDALTWVMGEQGAKSLRGAKMADVIFAGTALKPALGRAEVSLTIDNSDGVLPIDYTEVTITRTMFRGGGSEYAINGTPARLLDIQELLSDTGMGKQMHVIVGQGQLDAILSATPVERRGFIEESAGILKHRRRKERALRKLESMSDKAARVQDLASELKRQLGPLARQAKAARRAAGIQAQLTDARSRLVAADLAVWQAKLNTHSSDVEELKTARAALLEELGLAKQNLREAEQAANRTRAKFDAAVRAAADLGGVLERTKSLLALAQERERNLSQAEETPRTDPKVLDEKAQAAKALEDELSETTDRARLKLTEIVTKRAELDAAEAAAANEFARLSTLRSQLREQRARLEGDIAQAKSRLESAENLKTRAQRELAEAQERFAIAQKAVQNYQPVQIMAQGEAVKSHDEAIARRDRARQELDDLLAQEREVRNQASHWQARAEALSQATVPDDVTAELLKHEQVTGQLSKLFTVTKGWEGAIAAALQPFTDAGVTTNAQAAQTVMASFNGAARLLFGAAESDAERMIDEAAPAPSAPFTWALHLVSTQDPESAQILQQSLQGIAVAEDDSQARELLDKYPQVHKVVTSKGSVHTRWSIQQAGEDSSNVLALRAEYESAQKEAALAQQQASNLGAQLEQARQSLDQSIREANLAIKALRAADAKAAEAAAQRSQLETAERMAQAECERAEAATKRAEAEATLRQEQLAEAQARQGEKQNQQSEPDVEEARAAMEAASQAARQIREEETEIKLQLATTQERLAAAQGRTRSLLSAAERERSELARRALLEKKRTRALSHAKAVAAQTQILLQGVEASYQQAVTIRAEVSRLQQEQAGQVGRLRDQIENFNQKLGELLEGIHRDEVACSEINAQVTAAERSARLELGVEPLALVAQYGPEQPVPEWLFRAPVIPDEDAEEETPPASAEQDEKTETRPFNVAEVEAAYEAAQRRMERLGKVNPLALEEHRALSERYEYITTQLADLHQSRKDLLKIVDEVDDHVLKVFESAFNDTAQAFQEVFSTLFPGGRGRLVLTEPEDLLSSGIEVEARPAGKKVSRLSLLSGGERSLVAVAMLIAIFMARPSPFYVMDEVEAALDDTNLGRLLGIFKRLKENSQLIVITHQKRTMEVADALYGITMRDGVTKVVSQRLEERSH